MATIHITKGHNLVLAGSPEKSLIKLDAPKTIKIVPDDFQGIKPKLLVKEGDNVSIGDKLFFDKNNPDVFFCTHVSGTIEEINLGARRKLEYIQIANVNDDHSYKKEDIVSKKLERDSIIDTMLEYGLWPCLRQRPFSKIANPKDTPKSIFISAMPTAPFSMDMEFVLSDDCSGLSKGIEVLNILTSGDVNIVTDKNKDYSIFNGIDKFVQHEFSGPHPAGNIGIHIHHIDPISGRDDTVWYISLQDLNDLGKFFNEGIYPIDKCISVGGSYVSKPAYYKIKKGTLIADVLKDIDEDDECIYISGDVLSGVRKSTDMPISFYHETLSVINHVKKRDFLGWILPGLEKYSLSRTFLSSIFSKSPTHMDTRINGSRRAIIPFGRWEAMLPMDLMPDFIVKSIIARDIEDMEKYGIYECDHEDFALCAYACQSKVEVSKIVKEGLEFIEREG